MRALKIAVSISAQTLTVEEQGSVIASFPVSTSRFGVGSLPGSLKTPIGEFKIAKKIGHGQPSRTVFVARLPVGEEFDWTNASDLITSRILWLEGLEAENANTRERFIYIHGTNREEEIGLPASHGCIRLRNQDIIALFDLVEEGDQVRIFA
jgi:lipoprotein-anchoring transpeptidase ErfK/SrfK